MKRTKVFARKAYRQEVLHLFLTANKSELVDRCKAKVALRGRPASVFTIDLPSHVLPQPVTVPLAA